LMYRDGPEKELTELIQVSDSTFVVRDFDAIFQFKANAEQNFMDIHVINSNTMKTRSVYSQIADDTKLPLEMIMDGDFDQALASYKSLLKKDKNDPSLNENNLNNLGYRFLGTDKIKVAKDLFKMNMILHPESFNVYDSYAEACLKMGEKKLAIEYYQKSLNLNPQNANAKKQIVELEKKN